MKNLFFWFLVCSAGYTCAQTVFTFTCLNQSENKLLDSYGIDYTGPYTRYKIISGEYKRLKDTLLRNQFIEAFEKFQKWNKNYFKTIPDTTYFSDGIEYMKNKDADSFLKAIFNETRKITGIYSIKIEDKLNNIRTIEILEIYNTGMNNYIDHIIMIENYKGFWDSFMYDDDDPTLDCGSCMIP
ncbi:MAG: hypothetical protein FJZ67_04465 [Bacteroidetes bacterium]|nr:hypothetical protein [Bacteroidota bacterium]